MSCRSCHLLKEKMTFHIGLKQEIQKILHYMLLSNMKGRLVASYRLNFPCPDLGVMARARAERDSLLVASSTCWVYIWER